MNMDTHSLHHHEQNHTEEHMRSSDILRDIVIGMSDGLTVPFALAAGLTGAVGPGNINLVWIAGLAEIAAGSIAMGLGGFLTRQTAIDPFTSQLKTESHKRVPVPDM